MNTEEAIAAWIPWLERRCICTGNMSDNIIWEVGQHQGLLLFIPASLTHSLTTHKQQFPQEVAENFYAVFGGLFLPPYSRPRRSSPP